MTLPPPEPSPGASTRPTSGTADDAFTDFPLVAAPVGLALAVIGSGLNVPSAQLADTPPPAAAPTPRAIREEEVRKARAPVVRPRKQARQ